jgi:ribonuclease E
VTRRMLINAQRADEVRIAIVNGNALDTYEVAATDSGLCRGNIYRGTVATIQPSLDAAFVNFGVERDGLLRADDVVTDAYHHTPKTESKHPKVDRILERKKEILVQVVRDAVGHKGALVTSNLSIAGRYLVLMPLDDVRGVSRKLEDEAARSTIRERLERLELPEGCGVIARTNAADQPQRALNRDANALLRLWKKILKEASIGKGPRLLYSDQDLIVQALRDWVDSSIEEILVDDEAAFTKAQGFMRTFMPRGRAKLIPYKDRLPLFSRYELESQIEKIYLRKVDLPAGGSIVIDGTEALTAIDVNSGRATRGKSQEETAHRTNMEAAIEVARQLRMRDIGGLVVVDFIDMRGSKHRRDVEKAMRDAMKDDKAKHTTSRLSDNGLLEINRQRLKKALQLRTHRPCPTCSGAGTIASPELVGLNTLRRIETRAVSGRLKSVRVSLHPELADGIQNDRRHELADLEREFDIRVEIIAASGLHRSEEKIEWTERTEADRAERAAHAAVTAADLADGVQSGDRRSASDEEGDDPDEAQPAPDKPARKRRRGGRGRRKSEAPATNGAETTTDEAPTPEAEAEVTTEQADGEKTKKPARKRRRGGRRRKKKPTNSDGGEGTDSVVDQPTPEPEAKVHPPNDDQSEKPKKSRRRRRSRKPKKDAPQDAVPQDSAPQDSAPQDKAPQDKAPQDSASKPTPPADNGHDPFAY